MVLFSLVLLIILDATLVSADPQLDGLRVEGTSDSDAEQPSLDKLKIGKTYNITAFGKDIGKARFVLTSEPASYGANCNNFDHTKSSQVNPYVNYLSNDTDPSYQIGQISLDTSDLSVSAGTYYFCLKEGNQTQWSHAGQSELHRISFIDHKRDTILPVHYQVMCIALLLCLSGTFSGLNLGLMALDPQQLKILIDAGDPEEKKYAKKVLPCRKRGNFLLCTLLLGNVLVNNTLTIFLDDMTSGMVAVIGATAGIVVFGEIIPQAICSRHGLMIGYRTLPLTYLFMLVTGILSYPLGKLLDFVLGDEVGMNYNRERLLGLIHEVENDLDDDEKQMIEGALKLNEKCVKDVMTQINYVFTVPEDAVIDYDFMSKITEAGYSRIPVTKSVTSGQGDITGQLSEGGPPDITGLLFLRDLVMVDPDDRIEVSTVTNYYKHQLKDIDEHTKLDDMLETFKSGAYHLSLVTKEVSTGEKTTTKEITGIITLEDIIEEIICDEIVDETDKYIDNKARIHNTKREKMDPQFVENMKSCINPRDANNPNNPDNLEVIGKSQIAAVHRFLVAEVRPFSHDLIAENQLKIILGRPESIIYVKRNDNMPPLIERGKPINAFMLVIEGKCEMSFGPDEIPIEVGSFRTFGISALTEVKPTKDLKKVNNGSQAMIQTPVHEPPAAIGVRLNDEWRAGSCPPAASVPATPVTTPTSGVASSVGGAASGNVSSGLTSDFTVRITSDEFVYLRVTRAEYRQMRNQFEIRQAQKVSSIDNINLAQDKDVGMDLKGGGTKGTPNGSVPVSGLAAMSCDASAIAALNGSGSDGSGSITGSNQDTNEKAKLLHE